MKHCFFSDVLSSDTLHSPCASAEGALLHSPADGPAHRPVCFRDVPAAIHEDDLPSSHYPAHSHQVWLHITSTKSTHKPITDRINSKKWSEDPVLYIYIYIYYGHSHVRQRGYSLHDEDIAEDHLRHLESVHFFYNLRKPCKQDWMPHYLDIWGNEKWQIFSLFQELRFATYYWGKILGHHGRSTCMNQISWTKPNITEEWCSWKYERIKCC